MSKDQIAIIDVETTGLFPFRSDRIIEIGIVVANMEGDMLAEYETLINPKRDIGPTWLHGISAGDVLKAPTFEEVAGDVMEILRDVDFIAGHNVSFDKNFVVKEFERIEVYFPEMPMLCTCCLFGRSSLEECCNELGIQFEEDGHMAIADARATARIIHEYVRLNPDELNEYRLVGVQWPELSPPGTPRFRREHARAINNSPPRFLQRIAKQIHHDVEATEPNVLAYMALIDRVLEDRVIDDQEEDALVDAAMYWKLSAEQIDDAHNQYLQNAVVQALADGVVTNSERKDLHRVAALLGKDDSTLDDVLADALQQFAQATSASEPAVVENMLTGKRVCFTGELSATIDGKPIKRSVATALAEKAGLTVSSGVNKKLDLLVVADPNTQSGKAKKAREYGIQILADAVFWQRAGIQVD